MQHVNWLEKRLGTWASIVARRRWRILAVAFAVALLSVPLAWRAVTHLDVNLFNQASDSLKRFRLMRELTEDFGGDLLAGVLTIPDNPTQQQVEELKSFGLLLTEELSKVGVPPEDEAALPEAMKAELIARASLDPEAPDGEGPAGGDARPTNSLEGENGEAGGDAHPTPATARGTGIPWLRQVECRTGQGIEQALKKIAKQQPHVVLAPADVDALKKLFEPEALSAALQRVALELQSLPAGLSPEKARLARDPLGLDELAQAALARRTQQRRPALAGADSEGFFLSPDQTTLVVIGRAALPSERLDFSRALMAAVQRAENRAIARFRADNTVVGRDTAGGNARPTTAPVLRTALKGRVYGQLAENEIPGDLHVGFTGLSAVSVENEMSLKYDLLGNTATSFIGILLLFLLVFRKIRLAWDVIWTTALVIVMTLAVAGATRGSISILGGAFTCILLGTGTDYAIHLHNIFHLFRHERKQPVEEALKNTLMRCGPGIVTASLTTAVAFFGIGFTRFNGLAEFGFLAGVSILLSCVMMLTVFPALLCRDTGREESKGFGFGLAHWGRLLETRGVKPALLAGSALVLAAGVLFIRFGPDAGPEAVLGVKFDTELGNLRSLRIQAVPLRNRLAERFGLGLADLRVVVDAADEEHAFAGAEEVARRLQPFLDRKELTHGGSIADFVPSGKQQAATIEALKCFDAEGAAEAFRAAAAAEPLFRDRPKTEVFFKPFLRRLRDFHLLARNPETLRIGQVMRGPLSSVLAPFVKLDSPVRVGPASLPAGESPGRVRLASSWFPARLDMPQVWYDSVARALETDPPEGAKISVTAARMVGLEMKESLLRDCGWISLVVGISVAIALGAAFRSLKTSLLAVIPLLFAYLALLTGVALSQAMKWDFSLNFVNLIMFPLLLGSGIDVGIYMVYEALSARRPGLVELMSDTGRSVLCCTLTTLVGFGSFFWSSYTGLISLGIAAFFGYIGALFGGLVVLPALLGTMAPPPAVREGGAEVP